MARPICVLCDLPIYGYGNNAQPVKTGMCCDSCNSVRVIPARQVGITISDIDPKPVIPCYGDIKEIHKCLRDGLNHHNKGMNDDYKDLCFSIALVRLNHLVQTLIDHADNSDGEIISADRLHLLRSDAAAAE